MDIIPNFQKIKWTYEIMFKVTDNDHASLPSKVGIDSSLRIETPFWMWCYDIIIFSPLLHEFNLPFFFFFVIWDFSTSKKKIGGIKCRRLFKVQKVYCAFTRPKCTYFTLNKKITWKSPNPYIKGFLPHFQLAQTPLIYFIVSSYNHVLILIPAFFSMRIQTDNSLVFVKANDF